MQNIMKECAQMCNQEVEINTNEPEEGRAICTEMNVKMKS